MSSRDPIAAEMARRQAEAETDPIKREILRRQKREPGVIEDLLGAFAKYSSAPGIGGLAQANALLAEEGGQVPGKIESITDVLAGLSGSPLEMTPERLMVTAGVAGNILTSTAGLTGLPSALVGYKSNRVSDFFARTAQNLYTETEQVAMDAGMTHEQIAAAYGLGGFIGMVLPIAASVKTAGLITQTALRGADAQMLARMVPGLARHPGLLQYLERGPIYTDWIAGAIYGGVFREGDAEQRLKNMAFESAIWGAGRVVLTTLTAPSAAWLFRSRYQRDATGRITKYLEDVANGMPPNILARKEAAKVTAILDGERLVIQSNEAMKMLDTDARAFAFQKAVMEAASRHGTGGIFTNIGYSQEEALAQIAMAREKFPNILISQPIERKPKGPPTNPLLRTEAADRLATAHQHEGQLIALKQQYDHLIQQGRFEDAQTLLSGTINPIKDLVNNLKEDYLLSKLSFDNVQELASQTRIELNSRLSEITKKGAKATEVDRATELTIKKIMELQDEAHPNAVAIKKLLGMGNKDADEIAYDLLDGRELTPDKLAFVRTLGIEPQPYLPPRWRNIPLLKAPQNPWDVMFSQGPMSQARFSKLEAQWRVEGHFEGQILQHGGAFVEYVGERVPLVKPAGKMSKKVAGKVWIRANRDTKLRQVKLANLTDTPYATGEWIEEPHWDALWKNYLQDAIKSSQQLMEQEGVVSELDMVRSMATGRDWNMGADPRRVFDVGGALIHPEEAGLFGEESILAVEVEFPGGVRGSLIPYTRPPGAMSGHAIIRGAERDALRQAGATDEMIAALEDLKQADFEATGLWVPNPKWKMAIINQQDASIGHRSFEALDDALDYIEGRGGQLLAVQKKFPLTTDKAGIVGVQGDVRSAVLQPPPVFTVEDHFDAWATKNGIPKDATDYLALRDYFASRMRRWAWEQVPAEERKLYEALESEQAALLDDTDFPLEMLAHEKGFHLQRLPDGRIFAFQMDTGFPVMWGGERVAREGLQQIVSPEGMMPGVLNLGRTGLIAATGGFPVQTLLDIPDNILSKELIEHIPLARIRNLRDSLVKLENMLGGWPIATQGLDGIIQAREQMNSALWPEAQANWNVWRGMSWKRRTALAHTWIEAEEMGLDANKSVKLFKDAGFNAKEIATWVKARAQYDLWFQKYTDIDPKRYRQLYYSRVRPFLEQHPGVDLRVMLEREPSTTPAEFRFWAEMQRTGALEDLEMDPALVMQKYIRFALWKKYMQAPWDRMAFLVGTKSHPGLKIGDLLPAQQERILAQALPGTTENSYVLPKPLRDLLSEFLVNMRGMPTEAEQNFRKVTAQIFKRIGVKARPEIIEQIIALHMTSMYGAAIGMRPRMVARNVMGQLLWNVYTRIGPKWIGPAMDASMTEEAFKEGLGEGIFHWSEAAQPMGDLLNQQIIKGGVRGSGANLLSWAVAGFIQGNVTLGTAFRNLSREMLVWYATSEQQTRMVSYLAHKFHAADWLGQFEEGKISMETFNEEGLPFFDSVIKRRFWEIYNTEGRERALRYIGREGTDEANFLYISGIQPTLFQKPFLRPVGMFGTFTLWQWELYLNRMRNGTPRQIAKFLARNAILIAGFANMTLQTGVSMWNWMAPNSLGWFGGPDVQTAFNLYQLANAPIDRRAGAAKRLVREGTKLFFPGQAFWRDLNQAVDAPEAPKGIFSLFAGKPFYDESWAYDNLYNPGVPIPEQHGVPAEIDTLLDIPWAGSGRAPLMYLGQPERQEKAARLGLKIQVPAPLVEPEGNIEP